MILLIKRCAFWSIVLKFLGGFAACSLMILSNGGGHGRITQETVQCIKIGMTSKQVDKIVRMPAILIARLGGSYFKYYYAPDGANLHLEFDCDGKVLAIISFHRSQETFWEKAKRKTKEILKHAVSMVGRRPVSP